MKNRTVFPWWIAIALAAGSAAAQVTVDYQGSIPARALAAEDLQRMAGLPLQDLLDRTDGRYQALSDDGVLGTWGLDALVARQDVGGKPYARLRDSAGVYQTERVVFADLSTGAMMMLLTNQPYDDGGDEVIYFGKSCWSSDGAKMVWSRVSSPSLWGPGTQAITDEYGPMLVNGDGTGMRIAFRERTALGAVIAHPTVKNRAYAPSQGKIVELDLDSGQLVQVLPTDPDPPHWHMKMSPDGLYVCDSSYSSGQSIVVVSLEDPSQQWSVPLTGPIHDSYRFVPGNTDWLMFWYEGGFPPIQMANFKTGESTTNDVRFDWNHADVGRHFGVHASGGIYPYQNGAWSFDTSINWPDRNFDDSGPYYDLHFHYGAYLAHLPDDQLWANPTRYYERPLLSEIEQFFAKPFVQGGRTNRFRVCLTNLWRTTDRKGEETIVLDRPNLSRDGTKLLFNSNVFGKTEVYLVVVNKPRVPADLSAAWTASGVELSWSHPAYHQEIAGYRIYRSTESGRGFELLQQNPVSGLTYTDPDVSAGTVYFYALRSVEHSKLESELSAEVAAAASPDLIQAAEHRIFVEAEDSIEADLDASPPDGLWLNFDGTASNLHYLWQRRSDQAGDESVGVSVTRPGDYWVFARLKGSEGAEFSIAGQTVSAAALGGWQWVRSAQPVSLSAGKQAVSISSSTYGSCLDAFYLSTDADFTPEGRVTVTPPGQLQLAGSMEDGLPRLTWTASQDPRFYYYNLYCADSPDFEPGRRTLIASPDLESFLDWRTVESCRFYKVTQVTLDGLESAPSQAVDPDADPTDGGPIDAGDDAGTLPDAGQDGGADAQLDAGADDGPPDGGPADDGAAGDDGSDDDGNVSGGCGCSAGSGPLSFRGLTAILLLGWMLAGRRREDG